MKRLAWGVVALTVATAALWIGYRLLIAQGVALSASV
jgi:hypothetical protein